MKKVYIWSLIERFGANIISLLGYVFLARLLVPADFGLVGMVAIFTSIAYSIADSGMPDGLIRKTNIKPIDYDTVFVFNAVVGLLLALLFVLFSHPISRFFSESRLIPLLQLYGFAILIQSFAIVPMTKLRKELRQDIVAKISLINTFLSMVIAIAVAYFYRSYWAIVVQQLSFSVLSLILLMFFTRWLPRFRFNLPIFKEHATFGVNLLFSYLVTIVGKNLNSLFIAKFYPIATLGYYNQAMKFQEIPSNSLESALIGASYVIVAHTEGVARKKELFVEAVNRMFFLNILMLSFLFLSAEILFAKVLGAQWHESIPYFYMLLIIASISPLNNFFITGYKLFGKSSIIFRVLLIEKIILLLAVVFLYPFGVMSILYASLAITSLSLIFHLLYTHYILRIDCNYIVKPTCTIVVLFSIMLSLLYAIDCQSLIGFWPYMVLRYIIFGLLTIAICELTNNSLYVNFVKNKILRK